MIQPQRFNATFGRALQVIVLVYQAAAIFVFAAGLFLADQWLSRPFLGRLFEHTLVFNGGTPSGSREGWDLYNQGVTLGDQLLAVNGVEVNSAAEVGEVLERFSPGETIPVNVRAANGDVETFDVTLHAFPSSDRISYLLIPGIICALFLAISVWIFGLRRSESAGRAFTVFASSLAIATGALFDLYTTHRLTHLWTFGLAMTGGAFIDMALTFPQEFRPVVNRPYLRWVGYLVALLLSLYAFTTLFNFSWPTAYFLAWRIIYIYVGLAALVYFGFNIYHALASPSPVVKSQSRTILLGAVVGLTPTIVWMLTTPYHLFEFSTWLLLPVVLFPAAIGYTILRFRLLRTDAWVRQGLAYALLTVLVVSAYALLVMGAGLIFRTTMPTDNPFIIGLMVFLVAVLLDPLRTRLQEIVDKTFFRGQRVYSQQLQQFSHNLTSALDLPAITKVIHGHVKATLAPERVHIYIFDDLNDQYVAVPGEDGRPTSDIRFVAASPLAEYFRREHLPLYLDGTSLPTGFEAEESRLALLAARLFIGLPSGERVLGWMALGPRRSGQPYTPQDLTFLENLSDQASVAIERVQTVVNLERRVAEMNALTRVSQGVNITLTFDDVLELIYAQTGQILPTSDFHITLHNKPADYFYYGFCVENKDRRQDLENDPLPPTEGLIPDVIRKGRPLLTQDYRRECQARNVLPGHNGVYAWMGVPLNAGAETIGALSVGTRDPNVAYTRGQMELMQAIADQTAGAIVKARLLQETQRRAIQLSTLNEIARQLTSTLETEPLLQNILENAVGILNCEAGSLFLVDENTDELIFKVTVGQVASDLLGQRLPPGTGIVGRAVQMRAPVIENDAQRSSNHFDATDQQTGFVSKTLLAVPLQAKDRVIGVIEVINRRDGLPFGGDDQNLLTAFAGQAAVAIENSRLYTLTDQELAARVEELSVMQRIDRELNASLEMDRALRITLEWAMRQSGMEAGLIGMLEKGSGDLRIMAQQGYGDYLAGYAEAPMPLDLPVLRAAVESGQPQRVALDPAMGGSLLPEAHEQIVIPIRREAQVIGLIMLEGVSSTEKDLAFLNRLSDHAAIAISNAQLYNEVQAANNAKSEFVSFVAHELKNPMTSIKGYTELLAKGAVGQVNEMQSNFLSTIRSNVERMSTLVSDLNDNSKIEAGRLRLEFKPVQVPEVVEEVVRSTSRQIEEKKQVIEVTLPGKLPSVWADPTRIGQVLTNLVSNAHKYTPESGRIFVGAESTKNRWDPEGAARVVHLWVRDTGIGISPEDQQKIFQKFFRSEDQKAREVPGTGLGLNITKSLVEMQGGRIWFESEFRKGTTFHLTIPVAEG
ncbi:MAG: GAF domain-containing protein [Chloroflexota bacterium]